MEYSGRFLRLKEALLRAGVPSFRLNQLLRLLYGGKLSAASLKVLGPKAQEAVEMEFGPDLLTLKCAACYEAPRARKILFECRDGVKVEAVALRFASHTSLCISSQAGCSFNCSFCATGKIGFKRQLTVDEITDQVLYFQSKGVRPESVAFMGMGEPLANHRVFEALKLLTDRRAFGISARRLTLSTSGILPGIKRLNEQQPQVPANRMYPFHEVFDLLDERIAMTGRRIWIAYLLLQGVNDSLEHAKALAALIRERRKETRRLYHVSLIEYNKTQGVSPLLKRAASQSLKAFEVVALYHASAGSTRRRLHFTLAQHIVPTPSESFIGVLTSIAEANLSRTFKGPWE